MLYLENLPVLNLYLRQARLDVGKTQKEVSSELRKLGCRASQSLIAQIETGEIKDPSVSILKALVDLYDKNYIEVLLILLRDKYQANIEELQVIGRGATLSNLDGLLSSLERNLHKIREEIGSLK